MPNINLYSTIFRLLLTSRLRFLHNLFNLYSTIFRLLLKYITKDCVKNSAIYILLYLDYYADMLYDKNLDKRNLYSTIFRLLLGRGETKGF